MTIKWIHEQVLQNYILHQEFIAIFAFLSRTVIYRIPQNQNQYWKTHQQSPESDCLYKYQHNIFFLGTMSRSIPAGMEPHEHSTNTELVRGACLNSCCSMPRGSPEERARQKGLIDLDKQKILRRSQCFFNQFACVDKNPFQARQLLTQLLLQILSNVSSG